MTTTISLREQLGATPDPDFALELPPGWSRRGVGKDVLEDMLAGLKQRLMRAQQPQLHAELKTLLEQSFEGMRRNGAVAFFSATEQQPSTLWVPASIIAAVRKASAGGTLDDLARTLIREHGATPLFEDKRTLRFEKEKTVRLGTATVVNHSIIYLTPIPGSRRRRALELVAGFGRPLDVPADDPHVLALRMLFDTCVSTLRWQSPSEE